MALGVHGLVNRTNHILVSARCVRNVFEHFSDGLACDGEAVAMQQSCGQQCFHDLGNTAGLVQVDCQVFATGFEVAQHGGFYTNPLKVINSPLHICCVGNRQKVQHGVGRAAGGHDDCHGVFNGLAGHDIARFDVFFDGFDQDFGRLFGRVHLFIMGVGHGAGVGQGNTQGFKRTGHGVGGVHAAAGARSRDGALFNFVEIEVTEVARSVLAHRFKHADDIEVLAFVASGKNGAAVDINRRHIGPKHAHEAAGHVFIAAPHDQDSVHPLALDTGFDAIGNHLAADQRVLHAFGAHGHAIRDRGRTKNLGVTTRFFNAFYSRIGEFLQAAVARGDGAVAVCHTDHGFFEVAFLVSHGVVHRTVWSTRFTFGDVFAARVQNNRLDVHGRLSEGRPRRAKIGG